MYIYTTCKKEQNTCSGNDRLFLKLKSGILVGPNQSAFEYQVGALTTRPSDSQHF
jgi:hypothetical protein